MKRKFYFFLFTAIACASTSYVQAQISKGTSLLGGSINFSTQKNETDNANYTYKNSGFGVTPSFGTFIKQNTAVGGELSYSHSNASTGSTSQPLKQKNNYYGVGVFLRNYRNLGASGFYLFLQSRLGGELSRSKSGYDNNTNTDTETKGYAIRLNLNPGVSYAISPRFHIETGLNNLLYASYSGSKTTETSGSGSVVGKSSGFNAGASVGSQLEIMVGFRILLLK